MASPHEATSSPMVQQCIQMTNKRDLRVLVVENNLKYRTDHVQNLQRWGYLAIVAEGTGKALINDAKRKAKDLRCHAAIVDMRLYDDHDRGDQSGLQLALELKPARCIIVTAYGTVALSREAMQRRGAFAMVGKDEGPDAVQTVLAEALSDLLRLNFSIHPDDWLEQHISTLVNSKSNQPVAVDEVADLLTILFADVTSIYVQALSGAIQPTPDQTSALRQHSVVIRIKPEHKADFVVKFATPTRIRQEYYNFTKYVEDRLIGRRYAQLSRHKRLWNIGAIAYTFLGPDNQQGDITLLCDFYRKSDVDSIIKALNDFFTSLWFPLYQERELLNDSLFNSYNRLWSHQSELAESSVSAQSPLGIFDSKLPDWAKLDRTLSFEKLRGRFPDPRRWVTKHKKESRFPNAQVCIVQGDLHGRNLFVDEYNNTWVIDFERTGTGHVLADFIEVEHNIITELATIEDTLTLYELAVVLCAPHSPQQSVFSTERIDDDPKAQKCWHVIQGLRTLAVQVTGYQDQREYYWALLLDTLFSIRRLEIFREMDNGLNVELELQKNLLLGSILCRRLEQWGGEWPPSEWLPTYSKPAEAQKHLALVIRLREILTRLFPDLKSARQLAHDVGIDHTRIDFGGAISNVWQSILTEAQKTNTLMDLVAVVMKTYPTASELNEIAINLRTSQ